MTAKQKTERASFRISEQDRQMLTELADRLNLDISQVWRLALKKLHEQEVKK
jgi:hypothetical protein